MMNKFYLNVPYKEKDDAKSLGAKFDFNMKKWYYTNANDKEKFKRWIAEEKECLKYEQLSDEQKQLIIKAKEGKNVLVDACIGSGKTTTIQVLCNELKDRRILYLTYNKLLKNDAREKNKLPNVEVTNYHGFAFSCLKNANIYSGIGDLIQDFLKYQPATKSYDMVVIDEYQDIEQEIAEMLVLIKLRNPNAQFIVVGDMQQKIYDKTTLDVRGFIDYFLEDYERLSFTQCFRINKDLASQIGKVWGKKINGVNKDCEVKTMYLGEVVKYLATKNPSDILCLGQRTGNMTEVLNALEKNYSDKFNKHTVYASIRDSDETVNITNKTAIFTTYDSSKGMERPICVIFDFSLSYWFIRLNMPQQKYDILRNIFLVACSRGKREIIFVKNKEGIMKIKEIAENRCKDNNNNNNNEISFNISDMFSFKYKEDVEKCYSLVNKEQIKTDSKIIDAKRTDALIDISPCIGMWQEANFFKGYSIDDQIEHMKRNLELKDETFLLSEKLNKRTTLDKKILILTVNETRQKRYYEQVKTPFILKSKKKDIVERLATEFTAEETVQQDCCMTFKIEFIPERKIHCSGRCDVIKDGTVYELKFKSTLEHDDFLQLACYLVAMKKEKGILWNVKTNEKYIVSVPDEKEFLDAVINCITKGTVKEYYDFSTINKKEEVIQLIDDIISKKKSRLIDKQER